jgi:hypothetical protein
MDHWNFRNPDKKPSTLLVCPHDRLALGVESLKADDCPSPLFRSNTREFR